MHSIRLKTHATIHLYATNSMCCMQPGTQCMMHTQQSPSSLCSLSHSLGVILIWLLFTSPRHQNSIRVLIQHQMILAQARRQKVSHLLVG